MSPRRRDPDRRPTATAQLTSALRSSILEGAAAPGAPLREEELAEQYGVSRHTVRAALAALTAERLVLTTPYAGARVASLDDAELQALQHLRAALETEAVRLITAAHGTPWPDEVRAPVLQAIDALRSAEATGEWMAITRAHAAVHRSIVDAAASPRISQAHAQLESEILLLLIQVRPEYGPGGLADEHALYVDALPVAGGESVRAHLDHSTDLIRRFRDAGDAAPTAS